MDLEPYLMRQQVEFGTKVKTAWKQMIFAEGYTATELPFFSGQVLGRSLQFPCKKNPEIRWQKVTLEARCVIDAVFTCSADYVSHTSTCEIL